jgi:hypothetical protein
VEKCLLIVLLSTSKVASYCQKLDWGCLRRMMELNLTERAEKLAPACSLVFDGDSGRMAGTVDGFGTCKRLIVWLSSKPCGVCLDQHYPIFLEFKILVRKTEKTCVLWTMMLTKNDDDGRLFR